MTTELKVFSWHDDGNADLGILVSNIETVRDAIDEAMRVTEKTDKLDETFPENSQLAVESTGSHLILGKKVRAEMKISQMYIIAGGVSEYDTSIDLFKGNDESLLDKPITLKSTENTGKLKIGDILDFKIISQFEEIYVSSDTNRKISVVINYEAVD